VLAGADFSSVIRCGSARGTRGLDQVQHTLRPFAVAMAGENEFDPFKD
jgi:hypothetical protein